MTWWWALYLAPMVPSAVLAREAFADLWPCATRRGRLEVAVGAALLWPVVLGYLVAGCVMMLAEKRNP